jgi:parallel beta-helix repeat protein
MDINTFSCYYLGGQFGKYYIWVSSLSHEEALDMWARRASLAIAFIIFAGSFAFSFVFLPASVGGTTLYVGGMGPGNYTSIQDAVFNASEGDTVFVYNGTYNEQITVTKSINLVGLDRDTTIIKVNKTGRAIYVIADWVNISGFTMLAMPDPPWPPVNIFGVEFYEVEHCMIENSRFQTNQIGVLLVSSSHNVIANNTMINNVDGMILSNSEKNLVINNTLFSNNEAGIHIAESGDNVAVGNNASGNGGDGIHVFSSSNNAIYHNYLFGNMGQGFDDDTNCWDGCYPTGGNFFGDYAGVDSFSGPGQDIPGSDGIGDTAYAIPGGSNEDRYPLMAPASFPSGPSPPTNLQIVSGDGHSNLSWAAPIFDGYSMITNYNIYRATGAGAETLLATLGDVLEYSDMGLTNGEVYRYRVSATNGEGQGCKSQEVLATPASVPGPPQGLIAQAGIEKIILTWLPPADDGGSTVTNYTIYWATTSGAEVYLVTLGNVLTYTDSGLIGEQEYFYKVSATNGVGEGPMSNEASATALLPPPNRPPTCDIDSPDEGAILFGSVQIAGTADDLDGEIDQVEINFDNGSWIQVFGTSFWTYDWNTTQFSDGYHTIFARSFDGENHSNVVDVMVFVENYFPPEESEMPDYSWLSPLLMVIVIVVIAIVLILWGLNRRKRSKESILEPEAPEEPE